MRRYDHAYESIREKTELRHTLMRPDFLRPFSAVDQKQHGHADRQPICDLFEDHRSFPVSNLAADLHATVNWSWMHNQNVRFAAFEPALVQTEQGGILANAREH